MKSLLVILLSVISAVVLAQEKVGDINKKILFSSINSIGVLNGGSGETFMIQSLNGVRKDKWFVGIGAGIDHYYYRSVPLFIDLRRELLSKKNTPFLYVDGGVNLPWLTNRQKNKYGSTIYDGGLYYDAGVGWKLKVKNDFSFLFSAGYSFKQVKEVVTQGWWWGPPLPTAEPPVNRYDNRLNRIVIKIGCQL